MSLPDEDDAFSMAARLAHILGVDNTQCAIALLECSCDINRAAARILNEKEALGDCAVSGSGTSSSGGTTTTSNGTSGTSSSGGTATTSNGTSGTSSSGGTTTTSNGTSGTSSSGGTATTSNGTSGTSSSGGTTTTSNGTSSNSNSGGNGSGGSSAVVGLGDNACWDGGVKPDSPVPPVEVPPTPADLSQLLPEMERLVRAQGTQGVAVADLYERLVRPARVRQDCGLSGLKAVLRGDPQRFEVRKGRVYAPPTGVGGGSCWTCGGTGHRAKECPVGRPTATASPAAPAHPPDSAPASSGPAPSAPRAPPKRPPHVRYGKVTAVAPEKQFGFLAAPADPRKPLSPRQLQPPPASPTQCPPAPRLFFHFDRCHFGGLQPAVGDEVKYTEGEPAAKGRVARAVHAHSLMPRDPGVITQWLAAVSEGLCGGSSLEVLRVAFQATTCPAVWHMLLEAELSEEGAAQVLRVTLQLAQVKGHEQRFVMFLPCFRASRFLVPGGPLYALALRSYAAVQPFIRCLLRCPKALAPAILRLLKALSHACPGRRAPGADACHGVLDDLVTLAALCGAAEEDVRHMGWRETPPVPTAPEMLVPEAEAIARLRPVLAKGPYASQYDYFDTYFGLLRYDCFPDLAVRAYLRSKACAATAYAWQ